MGKEADSACSPGSGTWEVDTAQNSGRGAQSNCTSRALVGGLLPGLGDPLQGMGHRAQALAPRHSALALTSLDPSCAVVLLREQRKAKQGIAERGEELGNEEQNHLVQRVYCEFPGSEWVVGLSSRSASFTGIG